MGRTSGQALDFSESSAMTGSDLASISAEYHFFEALGREAVTRLQTESRPVTFNPGRTLFIEGDRPDAAYLLAEGLMRVFVTELDGTETTIRIVGANELFGELAVVDLGDRAVSAIALRTTKAFRIPADLLDRELPAAGSIGRGLLRVLVSVVRTNTKRLVIERSQRLESAVARALTDDPEVLHRINQGELAELLGVSRRSLNQTLRRWERDGLTGRVDGQMRVQDPEALRQRRLVV